MSEYVSDCCGASYKPSVFGEKWECYACGRVCKAVLKPYQPAAKEEKDE